MSAKRLHLDDFEELRRMNRDTRVMATLGGIRSDEDTRQYLNNKLEHWNHYCYGLWVFRNKENNRFVGRAGLNNTEINGDREIELAYALRFEFWGQGLATEMTKAILSIGFEKLRLPEIVSFTLHSNLASKRVMEKVGFKFEKDIIHAGLPHVFYRKISNMNTKNS